MNKEIDEKVRKQINKRIKIIMSRFLDEPVYSNNKFIENFCLFFSRSFYRISNFKFKIKYLYQRLTRGFDDLDKWNAAWFIARKSVPVLKAMRDGFHGTSVQWHREDRFGNIVELTREEVFAENPPYSFSEDEWRAVLDDIIFAFQFILDEDTRTEFNEIQYNCELKRHKRGLKLFSIYYMNLWD